MTYAINSARILLVNDLDSKVHGANMGPIWDPDRPHVGPMNFPIWGGPRYL